MVSPRVTRSNRSTSIDQRSEIVVVSPTISAKGPKAGPRSPKPPSASLSPTHSGIKTRSAGTADQEVQDGEGAVDGEPSDGRAEEQPDSPAVLAPSNVLSPQSRVFNAPSFNYKNWTGLPDQLLASEKLVQRASATDVPVEDTAKESAGETSFPVTAVEQNVKEERYDNNNEEDDDDDDFEEGEPDNGPANNDEDLSLEIDDDDGYEAIDVMSDISESSAQFEAEVERDIQAAGEEGIDWDDNNTYQWDPDVARPIYGAGVGVLHSHLVQPMWSIDVFGGPNNPHVFADVLGNPRVDTPTPPSQIDAGLATQSGHFGSDWSTTSSESARSRAGSDGSRLTSRRSSREDDGHLRESLPTDGMAATHRKHDDDGDSTDDERPVLTTLKKSQLSLIRRKLVGSSLSRRVTDLTPPRNNGLKRPTMRRLAVDSRKAICYTVKGPHGRTFRFIPPRDRNLRWIDIRSSRNSSATPSTVPSSPTMIDLQAALSQGNTGTGAYITDAIHGRLFQQFHCSIPLTPGVPQFTANEFERNPLLTSGVFDEDPIFRPPDDMYSDAGQLSPPHFGYPNDGHDLIDFDGGLTDAVLRDRISYSDPIDRRDFAVPTMRPLPPSPKLSGPDNDGSIAAGKQETSSSKTASSVPQTPVGKTLNAHVKNESISSNIRGLNLTDENSSPFVPPSPIAHGKDRSNSVFAKSETASTSEYMTAETSLTPRKRSVSVMDLDDDQNENLPPNSSPITRKKSRMETAPLSGY